MSIDQVNPAPAGDDARRQPRIDVDRHSTVWRTEFRTLSDDLPANAPIAWNETYGGYWMVTGNKEVFDIVRRADVLSNDNDIHFERNGYDGIQIPPPPREQRVVRGGILEMDPPEQRYYRNVMNPYLSPAAVARWQPVMDELVRACLDDHIESGRIDFVDDLANIVPAVLTMAMLGLPLEDWVVYCEPSHATVYTHPDSPEIVRVRELQNQMGMRAMQSIAQLRTDPRPGLIDGLIKADISGHSPDDMEVLSQVTLLIGGGFDTTTALTAHALEWLSENPDQRERLVREWEELRDSATEEFLRYYTPAPGDGRTFSADVEIDGKQFKEGERLWVGWATSNRDPGLFEDPHEIKLDRKGNRHSSFGLGIHRCIGSNVARATFKTMLKGALDRMPDFVCDPAGAVHYDTTGTINGMKHLPATFTPGKRLGPGVTETVAGLQRIVDEQRLAEPVTARKQARLTD
ncbi:cytochrome P450 [Trujillonella endophytica]|uniref:Cytochrome P450 n=1 Tax=Trujillonella endophytica TaxID=673521 RepID=A0A1H8UQP9_9ACTN|nr:cytochrome P450 [Trujillella endophytica]SEP05337.1 Cytochrome P450 [Trujillella endophytica]